MKEYEILRKFDLLDKPIEAPFDLVSQALYTKSAHMLNLEFCKAEIAEVFKYLELKSKFDDLYTKSENKLRLTFICFEFEGFKFETLDEVERALNNKAFL